MHRDIIADKSGLMAALVNCEVSSKFIRAGFTYFRGGLSGVISVFDEAGREYKIKIPDTVRECDTEFVRVSSYDDIKVYLA